jgi:hypothetical protein
VPVTQHVTPPQRDCANFARGIVPKDAFAAKGGAVKYFFRRRGDLNLAQVLRRAGEPAELIRTWVVALTTQRWFWWGSMIAGAHGSFTVERWQSGGLSLRIERCGSGLRAVSNLGRYNRQSQPQAVSSAHAEG